MIYGALAKKPSRPGRLARCQEAARQVLDEGGGESERQRRRGARERGKQRGGGSGEVWSYVACTVLESKRWTRRRRAGEMSEEAQGRDGRGGAGLRGARSRWAGRGGG